MIRRLALLGLTPALACGLQRDYEAFLKAAANDSDEPTSSTGSSSTAGSDAASTSTGEPGDEASASSTTGPGASGAVSGSTGSSGSSGDTSDTDATTGPAAVCGDGVVSGDEECDDPGDTACFKCIRDRLVFVTSGDVRGDWWGMTKQSIYWCNHFAAEAGLLTDSQPRFKPWISTSEVSAAESLHHSRGRYVLTNGLVFAESWDDLVAGKILNPLNVDEHSQTHNALAWTGTAPDGSAVAGSNCIDWTSESVNQPGYIGHSSAVDGAWTFVDDPEFNPDSCISENSLYCFESP